MVNNFNVFWFVGLVLASVIVLATTAYALPPPQMLQLNQANKTIISALKMSDIKVGVARCSPYSCVVGLNHTENFRGKAIFRSHNIIIPKQKLVRINVTVNGRKQSRLVVQNIPVNQSNIKELIDAQVKKYVQSRVTNYVKVNTNTPLNPTLGNASIYRVER
jgi:hypothetical protein